MYDRLCVECGEQMVDCLEPIEMPNPPTCRCGGETERAWLTKPPSVVGDEIDIHIKHGLCHPDGTPRHFKSKQEIKRATKAAGLVNRVRHLGSQGSDKSKHTSRWI